MDYGPYVAYMVELVGYPVSGYQARPDTENLTMKPTNISSNRQINRISDQKNGDIQLDTGYRKMPDSQCNPNFDLLDTVVVCFVFDGGAGWKVQHPPKRVTDTVRHRRLIRRPVPYRNNVLLKPKIKKIQ